MRRELRVTASALTGSATRMSCASDGRSTTIALLRPSLTALRAPGPLSLMRMTDAVAASAVATGASGTPDKARQTLSPPATEARKVLASPNTVSSWSLLGGIGAGDDFAALDHRDERHAVAAGKQVVGGGRIGFLGVGDTAQRQLQAVGHLLGDGDHLG